MLFERWEVFVMTAVRLCDARTGSEIFIPLVNVAQNVLLGFNCWYREVHLPAVAAVGLLHGKRDESMTGLHRYFATYMLADLAVR